MVKSRDTCSSMVTRAPPAVVGPSRFGSMRIRLTPKSRCTRPDTWLDRAWERMRLLQLPQKARFRSSASMPAEERNPEPAAREHLRWAAGDRNDKPAWADRQGQ